MFTVACYAAVPLRRPLWFSVRTAPWDPYANPLSGLALRAVFFLDANEVRESKPILPVRPYNKFATGSAD